MKQKSLNEKDPVEKAVRDIRRRLTTTRDSGNHLDPGILRAMTRVRRIERP